MSSTVTLPNGMTYSAAHQADFQAGVVARQETPDGIAANRMPAPVYLDDARRQAFFAGWASATR